MDAPITERATGFWRRALWPDDIRENVWSDVILGIVAPALCLWFDPFFFRITGPCNTPIYGPVAHFVFTGVGFGAMTLIIWLIFGERLGKAHGLFAGVFFAGVLVASGVGIGLFPFSVIGLAALCLGALGFIPFVAALVYLRQALLAWRLSGERPVASLRDHRQLLAIVGFVLALSIPAVTQLAFPYTPPQISASCYSSD